MYKRKQKSSDDGLMNRTAIRELSISMFQISLENLNLRISNTKFSIEITTKTSNGKLDYVIVRRRIEYMLIGLDLKPLLKFANILCLFPAKMIIKEIFRLAIEQDWSWIMQLIPFS